MNKSLNHLPDNVKTILLWRDTALKVAETDATKRALATLMHAAH